MYPPVIVIDPGLLSVIGLLVGISFLFSGFDLLGFSSRFHSQLDQRDV